MTNEQVICAARQLSEFCNKKACASCSFYKDDCTLKSEPRNWGFPSFGEMLIFCWQKDFLPPGTPMFLN